ncbi:MAG: hypothetical protein SAL07_14795 [Oscillatoria sp. PMC 1051.18]|nr:hypothetical protein [Oscillatoria sp. PMC 1050.18]MEC5031164.1 hypothetical protein [Oscillatoria sp. PMC 1051.18]
MKVPAKPGISCKSNNYVEPIKVVEKDSIEAQIFQVPQGYRVVINSPNFYWHPGIFWSLTLLEEWLILQLERLEASLPLGGDWLMLEGDFDSNEFYRGWFIYDGGQVWQGYDPLTNRCYTGSNLRELKNKIDRLEAERW